MPKPEILKLLKKKDDWMSITEMMKYKLGSSRTNVSKHLRHLVKRGEVIKKDVCYYKRRIRPNYKIK